MRQDEIEIWTTKLTNVIRDATTELTKVIGDESICAFAVDCHPWHGYLQLAVLTVSEYKKDSHLLNSGEIAAWKHFHFIKEDDKGWNAMVEIAEAMKSTYENSSDHAKIATDFLKACAKAVKAAGVKGLLTGLLINNEIKIYVCNPDNEDENFYPSVGS